jgi:hypothetical protein
MRFALALFLPILVRVLKALRVIDLTGIAGEDLVDAVLSLLSAAGGFFWMVKRVKAGNNPASDIAPIRPPDPVGAATTLVKRLTKG